MEKEDLIKILAEKAHIIREETKSTNDITLPNYVDVKRAYGSPEFLKAIAEYIVERIDSEVTHVAVNGHGGIPLGVAVGLAAESKGKKLGIIYVRDGLRGHGKPTYFDGCEPTKESIVDILDDVWTTGGSIMGNEKKYGIKNRLEDAGAKVNTIWNVVLRSDQSYSPPENYKHVCIFKSEELEALMG